MLELLDPDSETAKGIKLNDGVILNSSTNSLRFNTYDILYFYNDASAKHGGHIGVWRYHNGRLDVDYTSDRRDRSLGDMAIPIRVDVGFSMRDTQVGFSYTYLTYIPYDSGSTSYEQSMYIVASRIPNVLGTYDQPTGKYLEEIPRGTPVLSRPRGSTDIRSRVITIYDPVPNSLEERPSMLDLLQGNLNSINDIYNS